MNGFGTSGGHRFSPRLTRAARRANQSSICTGLRCFKAAIEERERAAAKKRQREHGKTAPGRPNTRGKFPPVSTGEARDKVAAAVGMSARTLKKATAVVEAAGAGGGKGAAGYADGPTWCQIGTRFHRQSPQQGRCGRRGGGAGGGKGRRGESEESDRNPILALDESLTRLYPDVGKSTSFRRPGRWAEKRNCART